MDKKINLPFVKSRGFECGQTCAVMMLKHFKPDLKIDFELFNKLIHHKKGNYTFPLQLAILIEQYGLKVKCFSSDNIKITKEDPDQFRRWFGKDYAYEMQFIDLESYDWMVKVGKEKDLFEKRSTSLDEILAYFTQDRLVSFPIDWNTLNGKIGPYEGHFVVVSGVGEDSILLHDPDVGPYVKHKKEAVGKAYNHPAISDDVIVVYGEK